MKTKFLPLLILILLATPPSVWAAEGAKPKVDDISNPYLILMIVVAIVLLFIIAVLNYTIVSASKMHHMAEELKKKGSTTIKPLLIIGAILIPAMTYAQEAAVVTPEPLPVPDNGLLFGMSKLTFYALFTGILFELIVIAFQISIIRGFMKVYEAKNEIKPLAEPKPVKESIFWKRFNRSVAIEEEEAILFEHEYDGIRELDNNLPPWWKYGFYLTIFFAVFYLIHYHIAKSGPLQEDEYKAEIAAGERQVAEYLKNAADNVDESSVKFLSEKSELEAGKGVYTANCVACHGPLGEGKVGPNLTDEYWQHGGSVQDIFKSVKYGWTDKGMKSWKEDLTPKQMAQVTSYIMSLQGSNPPNGLPPKGEKYVPEK